MGIVSLPVLQRLARLEIVNLTVRWALLFVALLWLLPEAAYRPAAFYAWWALAVVNCVLLTVLFVRHRFTIYLYYLSNLVDVLLISGAVYAAGENGYFLLPLYLLVIAEATLKFTWRGGMVGTGLSALLACLAVLPSMVPMSAAPWLWMFIVFAALCGIAATSLLAEKELSVYSGNGLGPQPQREGIEREVLLQVVGQMSAGPSPNTSFRSILGVIRDFFQADVCLLYEVNDQAGRLEVAASVDGDLELFRLWQGLYAGKMADCPMQRSSRGLIVEDRVHNFPCSRLSGSESNRRGRGGSSDNPELPCKQLIRARSARSFMCVPVCGPGEGHFLGVLHCIGLKPFAFSNADLELLASVANQLAPAWQKIEPRSGDGDPYLEPATGIYNRAYFDRRLAEEIARARRYSRPLSLALLVMNWSASLAAAPKPGSGGSVELLFAQSVKRRIRQVDAACQLGPGEIAVILPETDREQAGRAAERIRRETEKAMAAGQNGAGEPIQVSLTSAVVSLSPEEEDSLMFLRRAEDVLRRARSSPSVLV